VSDANVVKLLQPGSFADPLTEVLRNGARALLAQAIEAEVAEFLAKHVDLKTATGLSRVVRHGHLPEREVMTGIGPVGVRQPRVRDRGAADDAGRIRFTPAILPPYARRSRSLEVLVPILYLKGISTGDFEEALAALLGKDAPGLSASTIARLKEVWIDEHEHWRKRDLSAKHYVYVWADGIYLQARLEDAKQCILVIIGATPEGRKELLGFTDGARESAQDWRELLLDLKNRGLAVAPELAVCRRRAWLLEGARRAVADHTRATLLGAQDRQRPQQTAEGPAAESQAGITGDLDGGDEQGRRGRVRRLHRSL
jgi:putative transposase